MSNWVSAPKINTTVASDPVRMSGRVVPARSSMILGSAIVVMLKVIPPATIAIANSRKSVIGRATGIRGLALLDLP